MATVLSDFFESVDSLQLDAIPADLVDLVLKSEAARDELLPHLPPLNTLVPLLHEVVSKCGKLAEINADDFWEEAVQQSFDIRRLVALLTFLVEDCQEPGNNGSVSLQLGFSSAQCYLLLCCIHGANARQIFNTTLYERCIDLFRVAVKLHRGIQKEKSSGSGRKKGRSRHSNELQRSQDDPNETEVVSPDRHAAKKAEKLCCGLLKCLWKFLGCHSLKGYSEVLHHTGQLLCDVLMIDVYSANVTSDVTIAADLQDRNISELAFANLHRLSQPKHGRMKDISLSVLKSLFPLLRCDSSSMQWTNTSDSGVSVAQFQLHVRQLTLVFIAGMLDSCEEVADRKSVANAVVVLIQHLCDKVIDRAENRRCSTVTVITLILQLPSVLFGSIFKWLMTYSRSAKVLFRSFGLEVLSSLLSKLCEESEELTLDPELVADAKLKIIGCVISRCSDKTASIRAKAIGSFGHLLSWENGEIRRLLVQFCTPQVARKLVMDRTPDQILTPLDSNSSQPNVFGFDEPIRMSIGGDISLLDGDGFASLLLRRCNDDKIPVRKASLQAFEALLRFLPAKIRQPDHIDIFAVRCADPAVSVRRQALDSLTSLLQSFPELASLRDIWCDCVMPLVVDRESTVADRAMEIFNVVVVSRLDLTDEQTAWAIVERMERLRDSCRYLQRIFQHLKKTNKLPRRMIESLYHTITVEPTKGQSCWMLLAELSTVVDVRATKALEIWDASNRNESCMKYLSRIVSQLPRGKLSEETVESLALDLSGNLSSLRYSFDSLSPALFLLGKLLGFDSPDFTIWCQKTLADMEDQLHRWVFSPASEPFDEEICIRCVFTIGELIQLQPKMSSQRTYISLESVVSKEGLTVGVDQVGRQSFSAKIRGIAVLTMGKMCLLDEDHAKKTVSLFAQLLDSTGSWLIRNNIVIVLADLCTRFTSIVDRYIGQVAKCLKDPSPLVRKQTLSLLTNLLKEDFLKWRGILFIQFLSGLLDEHPEIRKFTEFCLVNVLLQRHPGMVFNHFVESIFQLNRVAHGGFNKVAIEDSTGKFSFCGEENRQNRLRLYTFMLAQLNPVQKFQISCKLSVEVLGAVVDEKIPVQPELLLDILQILTSKEIKFAAQLQADPEDDEIDEVGAAEKNSAADALKKAITQGMRQNTVENVVPIVIGLKHLFEKRHSPLLRYVMLYLKDLLKDFKNEIAEILAADRELAAEIEFDMKRFDGTMTPTTLRTPPAPNPTVALVSKRRNTMEIPQLHIGGPLDLRAASTPFHQPDVPDQLELRAADTSMSLSPITARSALKGPLV